MIGGVPAAPEYAVAPSTAWLDAAEQHVDDTVAWLADVRTGATYVLKDAAWLIWTSLAAGPATVDELCARIEASGIPVDLGPDAVRPFIDGLVEQGLVARR